MLAGAAAMDAVTRKKSARDNPAALLALMWLLGPPTAPWHERHGRPPLQGPPAALLALPSSSLSWNHSGKETDLAGHVVNQGIAVYGKQGLD